MKFAILIERKWFQTDVSYSNFKWETVTVKRNTFDCSATVTVLRYIFRKRLQHMVLSLTDNKHN